MVVGALSFLGALVFTLKKLSNLCKCAQKLHNFLYNLIFFNAILRFLVQKYIQFAIISIITLNYVSFATRKEIVDSTFAFILAILLVLFYVASLAFLLVNQAQLGQDKIRKRCGTLYANIKYWERASVAYGFLFMVRRHLFAVVALTCTPWPFLQVHGFIVQCMLHVVYIIKFQTFESPILNHLEIFNEFCILGASYHMIIFTNFVDNNRLKYNAGWTIIIVVIIVILTNLGYMVVNTFKLLRSKIRKFLDKKALAKAKKYHQASPPSNVVPEVVQNSQPIHPEVQVKEKKKNAFQNQRAQKVKSWQKTNHTGETSINDVTQMTGMNDNQHDKFIENYASNQARRRGQINIDEWDESPSARGFEKSFSHAANDQFLAARPNYTMKMHNEYHAPFNKRKIPLGLQALSNKKKESMHLKKEEQPAKPQSPKANQVIDAQEEWMMPQLAELSPHKAASNKSLVQQEALELAEQQHRPMPIIKPLPYIPIQNDDLLVEEFKEDSETQVRRKPRGREGMRKQPVKKQQKHGSAKITDVVSDLTFRFQSMNKPQ